MEVSARSFAANSGSGADGEGAEEDHTRQIAIAENMHQSPKREGPEHGVARDALNAAYLLSNETLSADPCRVAQKPSGKEQKSRQHDQRQDKAKPGRRGPKRHGVCCARGAREQHQGKHGQDGIENAKAIRAEACDQPGPHHTTGQAMMRHEPKHRCHQQGEEGFHDL